MLFKGSGIPVSYRLKERRSHSPEEEGDSWSKGTLWEMGRGRHFHRRELPQAWTLAATEERSLTGGTWGPVFSTGDGRSMLSEKGVLRRGWCKGTKNKVISLHTSWKNPSMHGPEAPRRTAHGKRAEQRWWSSCVHL